MRDPKRPQVSAQRLDSQVLRLPSVRRARRPAEDLHDVLITAKEAEERFGIHTRKLYAWASAGTIRAYRSRFTRYTLYSIPEIEQALLKPERPNTPDYPHRATLAAMVENLLADVEARALSPAVSRTA